MVVDVRKTKSAKAADIFIQIKPRGDSRPCGHCGGGQGIALDLRTLERDTGVSLATWQDLMAG